VRHYDGSGNNVERISYDSRGNVAQRRIFEYDDNDRKIKEKI